MTPKMMMFFSTVWFLSVIICATIEGSQLGVYENSALNELLLLQSINIMNMWTVIPTVLNGVWRLFLWDYSFYTGGYVYIRYFWIIVFSIGGAWGIITGLGPTIASMTARLGSLFSL